MPLILGLCLPGSGLLAQTGEPPSFGELPQRQFLRVGERLFLEMEVLNDESAVLQWYHNGEMLEGETASSFEIEAVNPEDAGKYYLTATNAFGTTYSAHVRVSVNPFYLDKSVARQWMEELLEAIRQDYPAPTVHSRNLFTLSTAMWDAWAVYDRTAVSVPYVADENPVIPDDDAAVKALREEAISYAAYRILRCRFRFSPGKENSLPNFRERMELLGYDPDDINLAGDSPVAVGNRVAAKVLAHFWPDGANELQEYKDQTGYEPVNAPLLVSRNEISMNDPNHWQPLALDFTVLQNGIPIGTSVQTFLGSNWGWVEPFALVRENPNDVYDDPGPPPYLGYPDTDQEFKDAALEVIKFSSWLDPTDPTLIDVSPGARHNNPLGTNDGTGYPEGNPVTGQPYEPNIVLRADYGRILAEFWADGPDSETPPGHWNSVANYVADTEGFVRRFEGEGPELDPLEWDVKVYFAINGAVSDAAIAAWDAKRKYDYVRPISMIRYMGSKGQSSDENLPAYDPEGLPLVPGLVELITEETAGEGGRHAHLAEHVGEIAVYGWLGEPEIPTSEFGGVGWIRAVDWVPYQRSTFVSPPFAGYVSGHSTFSRASAEVLTAITGTPYFPGGFSTFSAKAHEFLEFESGPENDVTLTWATYYDAADEAGISRLYGGIHVRADDFGGREMGHYIGLDAFAKAKTYFEGSATTIDWDETYDDWVAAMIADSTQNPNPDFYASNRYGHLSRFFLGGSPVADISPDRQMKLDFLFNGQSPGVEFYLVNSLVEYEYEMQVCDDMTNWQTLDPEDDLFIYPEEMADGLRRIRIFNVSGQTPEDNGSQFLRVLVREKY